MDKLNKSFKNFTHSFLHTCRENTSTQIISFDDLSCYINDKYILSNFNIQIQKKNDIIVA